MFSILWFILKSITDFAKMLFTIQVDNNLSLGLLMCICFIFFPMMLRIIKFIRQDALEELDDAYDSSRPIHTTSDTLTRSVKFRNGDTITTRSSYSKRRRLR